VGVHHPFIPPPTCKAYPIAILLHDHCALYAPPPTPPVYATHHTILMMAISCKGQLALSRCCCAEHFLIKLSTRATRGSASHHLSVLGWWCKKINRSQTHTHRQRTTHPTTSHTHAHDENNTPNKHLPQTLNFNWWCGGGACRAGVVVWSCVHYYAFSCHVCVRAGRGVVVEHV